MENLCPLHAVFPQQSGTGPLGLWQRGGAESVVTQGSWLLLFT